MSYRHLLFRLRSQHYSLTLVSSRLIDHTLPAQGKDSIIRVARSLVLELQRSIVDYNSL